MNVAKLCANAVPTLAVKKATPAIQITGRRPTSVARGPQKQAEAPITSRYKAFVALMREGLALKVRTIEGVAGRRAVDEMGEQKDRMERMARIAARRNFVREAFLVALLGERLLELRFECSQIFCMTMLQARCEWCCMSVCWLRPFCDLLI